MARYKPAIDYVISHHEGGYQCDPRDPGNWTAGHVGAGVLKGTKFGISAASFPAVNIKSLTLEAAELIYQRDWWPPIYDQIDSERVAAKLLDMAVNWERFGAHGPAVTVLQQAINDCLLHSGHGNYVTGVATDGVIGPRTVIAANMIDEEQLLDAMCGRALMRYKEIEARNPGERAWFKGWEARAMEKPPVFST